MIIVKTKEYVFTAAMDYSLAQQCANDLMAEHGLTAGGWSFAFNRRKRSLGICNYTGKRIELSSAFVARNDEAAVRDTILHEIAHALAGQKAGHGGPMDKGMSSPWCKADANLLDCCDAAWQVLCAMQIMWQNA